MASPGVERLELRDAARELGVHYQTAYRWVRTGRLPAHLTKGRYLVDAADVRAVHTERNTPHAPARPSTRRLEAQSERMNDALRVGDELSARQIARNLTAEGTPIRDLIQHVLVPALRQLGQDWHDGKLTIWVEHRASAIVERVLGELAPHPRGRRRGIAMVAAVSGDHHSLPTTMAAVTLRDDNWTVQHLGANMPPEELVSFCDSHDVTIAVITLTNPDCADVAARAAEAIRAVGTPTIMGGPGRTLDDLVEAARSAKGAV